MARRRRGKRGPSEVVVREATKDDVPLVAAALPDETHAELVAMTGLPVRDALLLDYSDSREAWYVYGVGPDGEETPVALGGISPDTDQSPSAQVWLVCTDEADRAPVALVRTLREWIQILGQRYGLLYGYVDARNRSRCRWLEVLGFIVNIDEEVRLGHLGLPFYQFISASPRQPLYPIK